MATQSQILSPPIAVEGLHMIAVQDSTTILYKGRYREELTNQHASSPQFTLPGQRSPSARGGEDGVAEQRVALATALLVLPEKFNKLQQQQESQGFGRGEHHGRLSGTYVSIS
eukprot:2245999-Rhodomonas_salina.1